MKSKLQILTRNNSAQSTQGTQATQPTIVTDNKDPRITKLENSYANVRTGEVKERDLKKMLIRSNPILLNEFNPSLRNDITLVLNNLFKFWIEIKEIITDKKIDVIRSSPKEQSLVLANTLTLYLEDSIIDPVYGIDTKFLDFLVRSNRNTTFLKEISICFNLYKRYINTLGDDFLKNMENPSFREINEIQPRFNMILNHIKSIKTGNDRAYNFNDEEKIPGITDYGLKNRLTQLNKWMINGLINTQYQINQINNLKPTKTLTTEITTGINTNYEIWTLLKDTEVFLGTMEDLLTGKAFIVGLTTVKNLEVLKVNY